MHFEYPRCPECEGPIRVHRGLNDRPIYETLVDEYVAEINDLRAKLGGATRRLNELQDELKQWESGARLSID